ncbi:polysaccharide deacetylase [Legionella birminghamensis]|uniref:Polysaccharide deacetylase n=1 Tax=Legionella birminghamensis TaxID=28083 RepID=A0A378IL82_9GAMM|nr:polysaccharide deacetylase family protein [Legionella birminghamensis]KTC71581.1 polysaccharide deacetylase [Legionella birminghamensis]STX32884.1 polysaccharide deacetylase [Legionella birminghamensis]
MKIAFQILLVLMVSISSAHTQTRQIAITIDDLPFVGEYKNFHLDRIINLVKENNIPVTGFVIAGNVRQDNWPMLNKFRDAGFGVGNHTMSHINLNKVDTETYIQEIEEADKILSPVLTEPKYFRYPYLAMGKKGKKEKVLKFLESRHYKIAPITIDSKDFIFNQRLLSVPQEDRRAYLEEVKYDYLEFIWKQTLIAEENNRYNHKQDQAQILLIHANILNAYVLPDIVNLYREHGYTFLTLEEALQTFNFSQPQQKVVKRDKTTIEKLIDDYFEWD